MSESLCHNCPAACCKGPLTMSLSPEEHQQMVEAGTELITIVEPANYRRSKAKYPAHIKLNPITKGYELLYEPGQRKYEPLAAGFGRYLMIGACGNLETTETGGEQCAIYENRPQVCQDFEMGGAKCLSFREQRVTLIISGKL